MGREDGSLRDARRTFEAAAREGLGSTWADDALTDIDRAEREPLRIAFVGTFSSGKSTLLNAWIGSALLPTDVLPTSAAIVEVSAGARPGFWSVDSLAGNDGATPLDEASFRRLATSPSAGEPVLLRAVTSSDAIPAGAILVDPPGIDSLTEAHAAVTYGYLPRCDAVVLTVNGQKGGMTAPEFEFVERHLLQATQKRLLIALTYIDTVPTARREALVSAVREGLVRHAKLDAPVVAMDARSAFRDRVAGGPGAEFGLARLTQLVDDQFLASARRIREERALRHLQGYAQRGAAAVREACLDLSRDADALEARRKALANERQALRSSRDALRSRLQGARSGLLADLAVEVDRRVSAIAEQAPRYVAAIETAQAERADPTARVSQLIRADLARAVDDLARTWLDPRLRAFAAEVGTELARLTPPDAPIVLHPVTVPGEGVLDFLVEAAVLVLLNFVLPGEWLVALVGRILGQKVLDTVLTPIKQALSDAVRGLLGGVIRTRLETEVRTRILGIRVDLLADVGRQVERLMDGIEEQAIRSVDDQIAQVERGADEAAQAQRAGKERVRTERARLDRAAGIMEALAAGTWKDTHAQE